MPNMRRAFWETKFERNVARDKRQECELRQAGWDVLVLWECDTRDLKFIAEQLQMFLGPPGRHHSVSAASSPTRLAHKAECP
jgi:DNA mismatch endonuclease (patch repair protein)